MNEDDFTTRMQAALLINERRLDEISDLKSQHLIAVMEIAKHLDPNNENVRRGDLIASIRDLAQIAISERGNAETMEARLEEIVGLAGRDTEFACGRVESAMRRALASAEALLINLKDEQ